MALGGFLKLAAPSRHSDPSTPLGPDPPGRLRAGPRRGAQRPLHGRAAGGLPGRRPGGLARAGPGRRRGRASRRTPWPSSPSWCSPTSTSSRRPASPGTPTSCPPPAGSGSATSARLGQDLLAGAGADVLVAAADRAGWPVPKTLTAVLLPADQVRGTVSLLGDEALEVGEDLPGLQSALSGAESPVPQLSLLLVRDMGGRDRQRLMRVLEGRSAVVGPPRPWTQARSSYQRAVRTLGLTAGRRSTAPVDSELHLAALVVGADPEALDDLCAAVLAPLADLQARHRPAAGGDAALLAAAPGPSRRGGRGPARARADGALPHGPAARAVRRPAGRPGDGARTGPRAAAARSGAPRRFRGLAVG